MFSRSEAVTLSEDNEMEMEMKDDAIDNSTPVEVAMEETKDEGEIAATTDVRYTSRFLLTMGEGVSVPCHQSLLI